MELKNSKEIIEQKQACEKQLDSIEEKIITIKSVKSQIKSYKNIKKLCKEKLEKLESELESIYKTINECNNLLITYSTFPREILVDFLTKCISFIENKKYIYTNVTFKHTSSVEYQIYAHVTPSYLIFDATYENDEKKLEETFIARHLSHFYKELLSDSKYILASSKKEETLLVENGLKYIFSSFPYLEEIAYNLIDRRLLEPNKDLQEILNDELESIKNIGAKKVKKEEE